MSYNVTGEQMAEAYAGGAELRFTRAYELMRAARALQEEIHNPLEKKLSGPEEQQRTALLTLCSKLLVNLSRRHMNGCVTQWQEYTRRAKELGYAVGGSEGHSERGGSESAGSPEARTDSGVDGEQPGTTS